MLPKFKTNAERRTSCAHNNRFLLRNKMAGRKEVSEVLEEFINYIEQCKTDYQFAQDEMAKEDKRLQDLLHELEFAQDRQSRNKVATKFQRSRRERRRQRDECLRLKLIVESFEEQQNRKALNNLRQLLGKQRTQEEYLNGKREYKPRVRE